MSYSPAWELHSMTPATSDGPELEEKWTPSRKGAVAESGVGVSSHPGYGQAGRPEPRPMRLLSLLTSCPICYSSHFLVGQFKSNICQTKLRAFLSKPAPPDCPHCIGAVLIFPATISDSSCAILISSRETVSGASPLGKVPTDSTCTLPSCRRGSFRRNGIVPQAEHWRSYEPHTRC